MLKSLKEIFRAQNFARQQEKRARRAMRFEMLEKRILPSASMLVPPLHAVVAPPDHKLLLPTLVHSDAQARQNAQKPAILAFKGVDSDGVRTPHLRGNPASSSGAAPWLNTAGRSPDKGNSTSSFYSTMNGASFSNSNGNAALASSTQSQVSSGTQIVFVDPSVTDYSQLVGNLVQSAGQSGQSVTVINLNQQGTGQANGFGEDRAAFPMLGRAPAILARRTSWWSLSSTSCRTAWIRLLRPFRISRMSMRLTLSRTARPA